VRPLYVAKRVLHRRGCEPCASPKNTRRAAPLRARHPAIIESVRSCTSTFSSRPGRTRRRAAKSAFSPESSAGEKSLSPSER